jgi:AraC family transcriptional regulator
LANVNVAARARAAGAHPAHASRLFRQCYGQSISEYAQGQSVRRALGRLAGAETTLSEVALSAGFYDQSHMSRVFRRVLGRTPGVQRALIAAAC